MPFGKYRGRELETVPDDYLCWVLDNCQRISPTLREAIRARLFGRPSSGASSAAEAAVDHLAILKRWHRQMVLRHHPDRGGEHAVMVAIQDAYETLRKMFEDALAVR